MRFRVRNLGLYGFAISATLLVQSKCPPTKTVESFQITFVEDGSDKIRVRYLDRVSGQWKSGQPPDVAAPGGAGAASTESGLMSIIGWTAATTLSFSWGLGATYDQRADETTAKPALSAPSIVGATDNTSWLLAFRTTGDIVAVKHYKHDTRSFTDIDYAPTESGAFNSSVLGRPGLARLGQTIVAAWRRGSDLRFAVGAADTQSVPTWTQKFGLTFPATISGSCYGPPSAPALATGDKFYLAFVRSTVRCAGYDGEFLSRSDLFLFASPNGATWQPDQPLAMMSGVVIPYAEVGLSAWKDGTLLVGVVSGGPGKFQLFKYRGGWTELNAQQAFGGSPAARPFSILSTKTIMNRDALVAPF
jgi:hypothetical protein